ncbi:MAG: GGDEF domain-containing protein [Acholeplasmataceae bacterium]|nr:GGDEF domain-containing protein [Acholeplasmataceae bacterium]
MAVFLRIDINLISMFMLGLVFLVAYKRLDLKNILNRVYLSTILVVMTLLFVEALTCIINERPETFWIPVSYVLHILLFGIAPILSSAWYILIRNFMVTNDRISKNLKVIVIVPVVVNFILALLTPIFDFYFVIDANNVYSRGEHFFIPVLFTYSYLFLGLIHIIRNRKNIMTQEFLLLITFSIFPIIGGIVQWLFYGTLLMWSSAAFALIFVYIYLQERLVHLDILTGTWTRKSFDYYVTKKLKQKVVEPFGGIFLDIDHLKDINDEYGHAEGDEAIKEVVARVRGLITQDEVIARIGGDEFIIISNSNSIERLKNIISDIELSFSVFNENNEKPYKLSCSFGYGIYSEEFKSIDQFLRFIDYRMYQSKKNH